MSASVLSYVSAVFGSAIVLVVACSKRRSLAQWPFVFGIAILAAESVFSGLSSTALHPQEIVYWQTWRLAALSLLPGTWLVFSLSYARGNYREFFSRWRFTIFAGFALPALLALGLRAKLIVAVTHLETNHHWILKLGISGFILNLFFLIATLLVLTNLEQTYRASVGTMRWRIKFIILGLGLIFGVRAYTASQALLYHAVDVSLGAADSGALLIGCALMMRSLLRQGHFDSDVYVPSSVLSSSLTILLAGVYFLIVGVFAKIVAFLGGDASFALKTFVVLVGLVLITLVLLSDRVRLRTRRFLSRHFQRPFYDYRTVWRRITQGTTRRVEEGDLCNEIVKLTSEIFQALSVAVWLVNDSREKFKFANSTSFSSERALELERELTTEETSQAISELNAHPDPVDVDTSIHNGIRMLKKLQPDEFHKGGNRVCVPLKAGGELLGIMMLGDRVSGIPFSVQDFDLLKSIADQFASNLFNIKLSQRLAQAKQLEAFQAMSAFFVHDLKNTASTLSMMLHNLPTHFNDPRFREDALRGVSKTVTHINELIRRLSLLRQELTIQPVEGDLNTSVIEALKCLEPTRNVDVVKELRALPKIRLDPAQMQNVVVNLVINARDALSSGGQIRVETNQQNGWVVLAVADNGCGMKPEFIQNSLFRPFQTTKKQGIGIGMFQCKMIVEAHHGKIEVQSELAKGTTFRIFLPVPI